MTFGGVHPATGQQQVAGDVWGKQARQLHRAGVGQDADGRLGQPELGMLGGDDQVGCHGDLEPSADCHPVDGGDHRRRSVGQFGKPTEPADAVVAVELLARRQVPSGGEELRSGAGEDDRPHDRVGVERGEGVAHRLAGGRVDGVGLRTIDGDDRRANRATRHGIRSSGLLRLFIQPEGIDGDGTVRTDEHGIELDLHDLRADDGVGQRNHEVGERVDVGHRPPTEAVQQRITAQLATGRGERRRG